MNGLKALEEIEIDLKIAQNGWLSQYQVPNLKIIRERLEALEIIIKYDIKVGEFKDYFAGSQQDDYYDYWEDARNLHNNFRGVVMTKEEFDLLKEALL